MRFALCCQGFSQIYATSKTFEALKGKAVDKRHLGLFAGPDFSGQTNKRKPTLTETMNQ